MHAELNEEENITLIEEENYGNEKCGETFLNEILEENFDRDFFILRTTILYCVDHLSKNAGSNNLSKNEEIDFKFHNIQETVLHLREKGLSLLTIIKAVQDWEVLRQILLFDGTYENIKLHYYTIEKKELLFDALVKRELDLECNKFEIYSETIREKLSNKLTPLDESIKLSSTFDCKLILAYLFFLIPNKKQAFSNFLHDDLNSDDQQFKSTCEVLEKIPSQHKRELMIYFTKYRKWLVQKVLGNLQEHYFRDKILLDLSFGSWDPGSDYDVLIGPKDEPGMDVAFAKCAETELEKLLGGPPGVVLDCNFYTRDVFSTTVRTEKEVIGSPVMQRLTPSPRKYFRDILIFKDATLALVKLRKNLNSNEWKSFCEKISSESTSGVLSCVLKKSEKTFRTLLRKFFLGMGLNFNAEEEDKLELFFNFLKDKFPVLFSKLCKKEYYSRCDQINKLVSEYRKSRKLFCNRDSQYPAADKKLDWLAVKIRTKFMKARFFGIEMYLSEGSLNFIGKEQTFNPIDENIEKNREKRRNDVSNYELLHSIYENLGDFFQDLKYYNKKEDNNTGQAFYRSAKYLQRILIASKELFCDKITRLRVEKNHIPKINNISLDDLVKKIDEGVYKVRKSSSFPWLYASSVEKCLFAESEMRDIFGANNADHLREIVLDWVLKINRTAFKQSCILAKVFYWFQLFFILFSLPERNSLALSNYPSN